MANNTALRAGKDTTRTITFKNKEHEKFYYTYLPKCRYQDVYHKAYLLPDSENFIYRRMLQNYFLRSKGFIRSVAGPYEPEY